MAENISKIHLVDKIAESTSVGKKDAKAVVDALFEHMSLHLSRGDRITITGFGTFEVRERAERQGVRPGTSERITIPASRAAAFKPGRTLKDNVNNR
jgi:DNA-binding protein HU-beta